MTESQKKYQEEYDKWKHVVVTPGFYRQKGSNDNFIIIYEVVSIDFSTEMVTLKNPKNGYTKTKTLHWARKNLEPYSGATS